MRACFQEKSAKVMASEKKKGYRLAVRAKCVYKIVSLTPDYIEGRIVWNRHFITCVTKASNS